MNNSVLLLCFGMTLAIISCSEDEPTTSSSTPTRLAKRQMHFTFTQTQDALADSLVDGAVIKLYVNFTDFDEDTAVAASGVSENGKLVLAGEDDGQAYYYRANHLTYGEVTGSIVNALFDDYYQLEFE